jgi:hypothetical protein
MHLPHHTAGYLLTKAREAFEIDGHSTDSITPFAEGRNSTAYLIDGEMVIKIAKHAYSPEKAKCRIRAAQDFYELLKRNHGAMSLDTNFFLLNDKKDQTKLRLVAGQAFIPGFPLRRGLDINGKQVTDLFESALDMYSTTGLIADIACIEGGLFDPFKSNNVIVTPEGNPFITDVDMGRIQSSTLAGPLWNRLIAGGVKRALALMPA